MAEENTPDEKKPADEMDYKAAYFKEVENSKDQRAKKREAREELAKRDATAKAAEQAAADAELAKKGDVEAITKSLNKRHGEINTELQGRFDQQTAAMQKMAIDNQIAPMLAAKGVKNMRLALLSLKDLPDKAIAKVTDGVVTITIQAPDGSSVYAAGSTAPMGLAEFVDNWLATEDGALFSPPSGESGSGGRTGGTGPSKLTLAELDRDPRKKAEFIEEHGSKAFHDLVKNSRTKAQ